MDQLINAVADRIVKIVETWPPWSTGDEFFADAEIQRLTIDGDGLYDSELIRAALDRAEGLGRITTVRLRYKHETDGTIQVIFYLAAGFKPVDHR